MLDFDKSISLLNKYSIPHCRFAFVKSKADASHFARKFGFPVAMKLVSEKIIHKTDVGAVKIHIQDTDELGRYYDFLSRRFPREPVIIQEMVPGLQVIVGAKRDSQFGPVVVFGIGGIFVEIVRDFSVRVAPVSRHDALEMIHEVRASGLFEGARGKRPVDVNKLADVIVKVSKMMLKNPEIRELDLNPVVANERKAVVVDVKVLQ